MTYNDEYLVSALVDIEFTLDAIKDILLDILAIYREQAVSVDNRINELAKLKRT